MQLRSPIPLPFAILVFEDRPELLLTGALLLVAAACLLAALALKRSSRARKERRARLLAQAAAPWGLKPGRRLSPREFDILNEMPLRHFALECDQWLSEWLLEGEIEGIAVRLFDLGYSSRSRGVLTSLFDSGERQPSLGGEQTLAFLPGLSLPLRFHRGPYPCALARMSRGWAERQGLLSRLGLPGETAGELAVVYLGSSGGDVRLPADLRDVLARMGGWVVESGGPGVLVYGHNRLLSPEELPRLLEAVHRLALALRDRQPTPPIAQAPLPVAQPVPIQLEPAQAQEVTVELARRPPRQNDTLPGHTALAPPIESTQARSNWLRDRLPLPGRHPPWWAGPLLLVGPVLLLFLVWLGIIEPREDREVVILVLMGGVASSLTGLLAGMSLWRGLRRLRMTRAAATRGPWRARSRLTREELAALQDLPLFRMAGVRDQKEVVAAKWLGHVPLLCLLRPVSFSTPAWALAGPCLGLPLRVFDLGYRREWPASAGPGWKHRAEQTVAVLPNPGPALRFWRGPAWCAWDVLEPGWANHHGLSLSWPLSNRQGQASAVLYTTLDAAVGGLPRPVVEVLAGLGDVVVESDGANLLLYRHDGLVSPGQLPEFIDIVQRVVAVLAETVRPGPDGQGG